MKVKKIAVLGLLMCFLFSGCSILKSDVLAKYDIENIDYLSYTDIDTVCDDEAVLERGKELLKNMEDSNSILMSFVIDSSIEMTSEELGKYDHLVMTNPQWIERFGDTEKLEPISFDELSSEMQEFLDVQMPVLTIEGVTLPKGIELYEYKGKGLLAFPVNVTFGAASPIETNNPLIILVNNLTETLDSKSCLLPLSSSGNLLFTDGDLLKTGLNDSGIINYGEAKKLSELE